MVIYLLLYLYEYAVARFIIYVSPVFQKYDELFLDLFRTFYLLLSVSLSPLSFPYSALLVLTFFNISLLLPHGNSPLVQDSSSSSASLALSTISTFLDMDDEPVPTQIHCYNIAKHLFSCAKLAAKLKPALEMAFIVSTEGREKHF